MTSLDFIRRRQENYTTHEKEILSSGHRYAVVDDHKIEYFDDINKVYKKRPNLNPKSAPTFGNLPQLIDIWKLNNTPEFQEEQLQMEEQRLQVEKNGLEKRLQELEIKKAELAKKQSENFN